MIVRSFLLRVNRSSCCRLINSSALSTRLLTLQNDWQQLNHIEKDLLGSGFTIEACAASVLPQRHRLLHQGYTALLRSAVWSQECRATDALLVFDSICARYPPNKDDLLLMIRWSRDRKNSENAVKILEIMLHSGWPLDVKACNQVIDVMAKTCGSVKTQTFLNRLMQIGFKPDSYTYSSMIHAAGMEGDVNAAESWFNQYSNTDISSGQMVVYGTLMNVYARSHQLKKCLHLMNQIMDKAEMLPNAFIFTIAIDAHKRLGQVEQCLELFQRMRQTGVSPTIVTYNAVIGALASQGQSITAQELYADLKRNGLCPDVVTIQALLNSYRMCCETAEKITSMSSACHRYHLPEVARDLLREALCTYGIVPDLKLYTTMVHIYIQTGHVLDAMICCVEMMASGITPDRTAFSAIMDGLSDNGSFHQCRNLLMAMWRARITPNAPIFNAAIASLRHHPKYAHKAAEIFDEMLARKVVPDEKVYCTLFQVLSRGKCVHICVDIFSEAVNREKSFTVDNWCNIVCSGMKNFSWASEDAHQFFTHIYPSLPFPQDQYSFELQSGLKAGGISIPRSPIPYRPQP